MTPPLYDRAARVALPLACAAAWWAVAAHHREPPVAAEAAYLGLLCGAVLLLALHAAPRTRALLGAGAVLLGAIPWALPGTPDRGAAVGILLAALLGVAAAGAPRADALDAPKLVAVALGAQLLARSGELLAPATAGVVAIVAWASVAAAATLVLRAHRGDLTAGLAIAAAFVLGPGFTAMSALALAAAAAATVAADRAQPHLLRGAAGAALLAPLLWDFERGVLLVLCAIALAGPAWARWTAALGGLAAFFAPGAERWAGLEGPGWLVVLLPILAAEPRRELATRSAALCLALAAAAQSSDQTALAAPAVVLALTIAGARPAWARLQVAWSGLLAGGVAVLAAYPWLRAVPLPEVTTILGLGGAWRAALLVLLVLGVAAVASGLAGRGAERPELAPRVLAILLVPLALAQHTGTSALPIAREPVVLDAQRVVWSARFESPVAVGSLLLDSALSNAAAVAAGTEIAAVRLITADGVRVLPLRAGIDTGEWAARRADVRGVAGFTAPAAFLHWVDSGGDFFGQRYRARLHLDSPTTASSVEVRLAPTAPPDVLLTLFHLELAP